MSDYYRVECTAIPDGIHVVGDRKVLRVSVVLKPDPFVAEPGMAPPDDSNAVALLQWPSVIPQLPFTMSIGPDASNLKTIKVTPRFDQPPHAPDGKPSTAATDWWGSLWNTIELRAAFARVMTPAAPAASAQVETYSFAQLAEMSLARAATDIERGLLARSDLGLRGAEAAYQVAWSGQAARIADTRSLLERDAFHDLPIGDAIEAAVSGPVEATADGAGFGSGPKPLLNLQEIYGNIRKSIRASVASPARSKSEDAGNRSESWNPFLQPTQPERRPAAATLYTDRYEDPIFGSLIGTGGVTAMSASTTALNLAAWRRARSTDRDLGAVKPKLNSAVAGAGMSNDAADNAARLRIAALQAHPALRKFAQLIVDIDVPLDTPGLDVAALSKGVVSVEVDDPSVPANGRGRAVRFTSTAFELDLATGVFEPCPQWRFAGVAGASVSLVPSLPLDSGVVQLNTGRQGQAGGDKRFRLEVVDANAATTALIRGVQTTVEASRKGSIDVPVDEPALRTLGLALLDVESVVSAQIAADKQAAGAPLLGSRTLLYAEDLVDGYRVDIVAPQPVQINDVQRQVFPAGDRDLRYDVIDAAFGSAQQVNPYEDFASRDEGYVTIMSRRWTEGARNGTPPPPLSTPAAPSELVEHRMQSEVIFTWSGGNLGLPTPRPADAVSGTSEDLNFVTTYSFAKSLGPILREGRGYRMMLRSRKLNGSSISPAAAERLLQHALGSARIGESYIYTPVERAPAPVLLVPAANSAEKDSVDRRKFVPKTLIVETGGPSARRVLVSPNIGLERAEQQGQFDVPADQMMQPKAWDQAVRRIERGVYTRLRRDTDSAGFPKLPGVGDDAGSALLFELVPDGKPKHAHYVDRTLCFLGAELVQSEATPAAALGATAPDREISFWNRRQADWNKKGQGFTPEAVVPVLVEAVAITTGKSRVLRGEDWKIGPSGSEMVIPVLRVEVARADTLTMSVWSVRSAETTLAHPAMQLALSRASKRSTVIDVLATREPEKAASREEAWFAFSSATRLPALQEQLVLSIRHPVERPRSEPRILELEACRRLDGSSWERVADDTTITSEADAEVTFAFGTIEVDRRSTGLVWAECAWLEVDPQVCLTRKAKRDDDEFHDIEPTDLYDYSLKETRSRLFTIENLAALPSLPGESEQAYDLRANRIDLKRDEAEQLRSLAGAFRSHKARRIVTRLVARSRFAPAGESANDYSYSATSADDAAFRRALAGEVEEGVSAIWLPATRPPIAPLVLQDRGILYRRRIDAVTVVNGHREHMLTHTYRCWLDGWFSSGEHELLAVVCRSQSVAPEPWLDALLSRWGGDMTMAPGAMLGSGSTPEYLRPDQLVLEPNIDIGGTDGLKSTIANVAVPPPAAHNDGAKFSQGQRNADIALLKPKFHSGLGRWYCDIELRQVPTFRAILQLSVARYQPRAIFGCELSTPVLISAFVLHQPWMFSAIRSGRQIKVTATGPAYKERAPMTRGLDGIGAVAGGSLPRVVDQAAEPRISVELERVTDDAPLPVVDQEGRLVVATNEGIAAETGGGGLHEGWKRWTIPLVIPEGTIEGQHLAVRVSLATAHANSKSVEGSSDLSDGPLVYLPEPLAVQLAL